MVLSLAKRPRAWERASAVPGGKYLLSLKSGLKGEGLWAADLKGLVASVGEAGKCGWRGAEYQVHSVQWVYVLGQASWEDWLMESARNSSSG